MQDGMTLAVLVKVVIVEEVADPQTTINVLHVRGASTS